MKKKEKSQIFLLINVEGGIYFLKVPVNFESSWNQKFVLLKVFFRKILKKVMLATCIKTFKNNGRVLQTARIARHRKKIALGGITFSLYVRFMKKLHSHKALIKAHLQ